VYTCVGFWAELDVPSPKVHTHDVGEPDDVSENATFNGANPDVGEPENAATGAGGWTVTYPGCVDVVVPVAFDTVNETV